MLPRSHYWPICYYCYLLSQHNYLLSHHVHSRRNILCCHLFFLTCFINVHYELEVAPTIKIDQLTSFPNSRRKIGICKFFIYVNLTCDLQYLLWNFIEDLIRDYWLVWLFSCVNPVMHFQVVFLLKLSVAYRTMHRF